MTASPTVLSALADGVLTLTLNRPDKLNSFNEEMHLALREGIQRAHDDSAVRAVLLTGAGRGFCAGQDLGANIAFACDIVLAAKSAKFIQAFARIGLIPDAGGTWSLARILGEPRAKALALTAEPLMAEKAADWGLIWKAVEDADLMAEAETLARSLAAGPTLGLGLTKRLIQQAATNSLDQQLDAERDCQQQAGRSADYAEGVTAFLEKRPARFTGK